METSDQAPRSALTPWRAASSVNRVAHEGYDVSGPTSCANGVLTAATCVARACQDGETEYDGDCHPNMPAAQNTAFLDEYMELGW